MAEKTGTTITCDRYGCEWSIHRPTPEEAREYVAGRGWTRTEDGRDFCPDCTMLRAKRKKPRDLVPAGVPVRTVFGAAEAAGWERREDGGLSHFFCCGSEVEYHSILGDAYAASCSTCGAAIESVLAPSFGRSSVAFTDSDKVDVEDPECWVVASEYQAATPSAVPAAEERG